MNKNDKIMMGTLMGLIIYWSRLDMLFPERGLVHGALKMAGFGFMFAVIIYQSYILSWIMAGYPYLRLIERPTLKQYHLFLDTSKKMEVMRLGRNRYARHLKLHKPVEVPPYGKVDEVVLHYDGLWEERVQFRRGVAVVDGIVINHPVTEVLEVRRVSRGTEMRDHAKPIPVFEVILASGDAERWPVHVSPLVAANGGMATTPSMRRLLHELQLWKRRAYEWRQAYYEKEREAAHWHKRAIEAEGTIDELGSELDGVLSAKGGIKAMAIELFLTFLEAYHTFDRALRALQPRRIPAWLNWKYITILGVAGLLAGFFYLHPEVITQFQTWLMVPTNQIFVIVTLLIMGGLAYYLFRKRRR